MAAAAVVPLRGSAMRKLPVALACLLLLTIPVVALAVALRGGSAPAPALPAAAAAPAPAPGAPPSDLLRVVVNNTGAAGRAVLEVDDATGAPVLVRLVEPAEGERLAFDVPAKSPSYTVTLHSVLVGGVSSVDVASCPHRALEVDFTTSLGLTDQSVSVGHRCLAGEA